MVNNKKMSVSALLMGSVVGGILGASVGFLLAPKPGKELRKDINASSKKVTEKAGEWKGTVQEKSAKYSDKAMAKKNQLKNKQRFNTSDNKKVNVPSLLMGSCVGGILGASVGLTFAPKPGSELREEINVQSKKALERAEEWKETAQDSETGLSDKVSTVGTKLRNKGADVTKKALIKAAELKEVVRGNDTETLERIVIKGTVLKNECVAVAKYVINRINEFSKIAKNITEFSQDATNRTKELYEDVSKKAESLKEEVAETPTEIKDEVVDQSKVVAHDAKDLKDDTVETTKNL